MVKGFLEKFNSVFSWPIASAMCGFGFFWMYMISFHDVWLSMVVGLYASALMSRVLPK